MGTLAACTRRGGALARRLAALALLVLAAPSLAAAACVGVRCGCPGPAATPQVGAPGPLTITYFGVSTLVFDDGRDRLVVDGFFTRPNVGATIALPIGPKMARIKEGLGGGGTPVRAILVAHAHHDHGLDAPAIAVDHPAATGAVVVGTPSMAKLARDRDVPAERICVPSDGEALAFGPYRVTAYSVRHGPSHPALARILDHPLEATLKGPAWFGSYKDDKNLSFLIEHGGRRILVHPSAGTRDMTAVKADTVFLGLGRVGKMDPAAARAYWTALVAPETRLVVPVHWDQFTTRVGAPLQPSPDALDDVDQGFAFVCGFAAPRPNLRVLKLDARASLTYVSNAEPIASGTAGPLCNFRDSRVR